MLSAVVLRWSCLGKGGLRAIDVCCVSNDLPNGLLIAVLGMKCQWWHVLVLYELVSMGVVLSFESVKYSDVICSAVPKIRLKMRNCGACLHVHVGKRPCLARKGAQVLFFKGANHVMLSSRKMLN